MKKMCETVKAYGVFVKFETLRKIFNETFNEFIIRDCNNPDEGAYDSDHDRSLFLENYIEDILKEKGISIFFDSSGKTEKVFLTINKKYKFEKGGQRNKLVKLNEKEEKILRKYSGKTPELYSYAFCHGCRDCK